MLPLRAPMSEEAVRCHTPVSRSAHTRALRSGSTATTVSSVAGCVNGADAHRGAPVRASTPPAFAKNRRSRRRRRGEASATSLRAVGRQRSARVGGARRARVEDGASGPRRT